MYFIHKCKICLILRLVYLLVSDDYYYNDVCQADFQTESNQSIKKYIDSSNKFVQYLYILYLKYC